MDNMVNDEQYVWEPEPDNIGIQFSQTPYIEFCVSDFILQVSPMSSEIAESIFLLGATGYVGGQVLVSLAADFPTLSIRALARNVTPSTISQLHSLHPKIEIVEGRLSDLALIEEEASKVNVVINVAAAGDMDSVNGKYTNDS